MKSIHIRRSYLLLPALLLFPSLAMPRSSGARKLDQWEDVCGTNPQRQLNTLAKARYYQSRPRLLEREGRRLLSQPERPNAAADIGNIAVIEDDGSVFTDQNPFDLRGRAIRFELQITGTYRAVASSSAYDSTAGTTVTLQDDDTSQVQLG